jgi:hypothetical protein
MRNALASILARVMRPLAVALVVAGGALSLPAPADAGGWHGGGWHGGGWHGGCCWGGPRFSLFFGFPAFYPYPSYAYAAPYSYPYPYPAYNYAPPYYPPAPPTTVVQQQAPPRGPAPVQYWYYCDNPRGFYPYVQSCGAGWKPVPAQPPGAPATP